MKYVLTDAAVRKLRGVLAPRSGNTGAGGAATPVSPDDFPPPFTVRWSASANNGAGAWVIWLPDKATLVMFEGAYLDISGVTAEQALPEGWYTIDNAAPRRGEVWLVVTITKSGSGEIVSVDAKISMSARLSSDYNILVADMNPRAEAKRVKQYVDSAVVLGGGGASVVPDDVSTEFIPNNPAQGADNTHEGELQIKGWNKGTPASGTTIAQDINNPPSNPSSLVERDHNGALKYKGLGTLAQLLGSTVTFSGKTILTGWNWNATTHEIEISTATISAANGVITSWTDQPVQTVSTTPISSIIPNS